MHRVFRVLIILTLAWTNTQAANWPQWRGPAFNGSSPETGLPEDWSATKNVAWKTPLPGKSGSTPIIYDDRVFISAVEEESHRMWALCLNRISGKTEWKKDVGTGEPPVHVNNSASPSPITDGKMVFFYFGTCRLVGATVKGKILWQRDLIKDHGKIKMNFGYASSPVLFKNKLYIPVLHDHDSSKLRGSKVKPSSYLLCIDPATGNDVWKQERVTHASGESKQSYCTPHPFEGREGAQIVINGADCVTGHDSESGKELWRSDNYNTKASPIYRTIPSVTSWKHVIVAPVSRGAGYFGIKGTLSGQLKTEDRLWSMKKYAPDVCTPLVYNDLLFVQDGLRGAMTCLEPLSGKALWRQKLGGTEFYFASPTGADGKIYCINLDGEIVVLAAKRKYKRINRINMGEKCSGASIAVAGKQLFIRTDKSLYCIGTHKLP